MDVMSIYLIVFFVFFAFIVVSIIMGLRNRKKDEAKMNELIQSDEFITKNREKYEQIINNNAASISGEKKEYHRNGIIFGILVLIPLILYVITNHIIFMILFGLVAVVGGIIFAKKADGYMTKAKGMYDETAKAILKELDSNLDYRPNVGFDMHEYLKLWFAEDCDRYSSEDMIVNTKTGFTYADIIIESEHEDDEGHTHYTVEFDGSITKMDIKNIGCTIILGGLSKHTSMKYFGFKKIMFEHDEFNKEFLCFTDNELIAYKVLTPDIMEEFVNVKKNTIGDINVRILNDKLYIRFSGTNGFDGREDSKEELFKSVAVLEEIMKTMDKVKKIIERKNMN